MYALSPSQKHVLRCPHRWYEHYVLKVPRGGDAHLMNVGILFHEMVRNYFTTCNAKQVDRLTVDEARAGAAEYVKANAGPEAISEDALGEALDMIAKVPQRYAVNLDKFYGVELEYGARRDAARVLKVPQKCGYWDDDAILRGRIDMAEYDGETFTIVDWATGWGKPDKTPQLRDYAMLVAAHLLKVERIVLETHYVRHGEQVVVEASRSDVERWWGIHCHTWDALGMGLKAVQEGKAREKAFPAKAGLHCVECSLSCPIRSSLQPQNVSEMIERYLAIKPELATLEKVLREHVRLTGPVTDSRWRVALVPKERTKFDGNEVIRTLLDTFGAEVLCGLHPSVSRDALESLAKRHPQVKDVLASLERKVVVTEFSAKAVDDAD